CVCVCFSFTSALGVGYLMVCTASYPNVLAFCFLDELQKEFIVTYDPKRIRNAVRPYSFIEFDTFIQKTKQRYNSPRSLSTKINLSDMQTEIKLRPPYQLSDDDLRSVNGFSHTSSKYKGI
ncbi:vesicle-trafficking protein SEC22a-like, partial [Notothenia coriiceps]|uniref:Vesicle-trafficking protein SEC22a-like n=1 Tax=Notothenia coriiceps TaxID=8208 RepID=A0A6I9P6Z7_9TELE